MEKLTKEQRNQVYRKALEILKSDEKPNQWICPCLDYAGQQLGFWNEYTFDRYYQMNLFLPEFLAFEPKNRAGILWFDSEKERIDCLNRIIEATNP